MEEDQRRPVVGFAGVVGSEPSQGPDDSLPQPGRLRPAHIHVAPLVFLQQRYDSLNVTLLR